MSGSQQLRTRHLDRCECRCHTFGDQDVHATPCCQLCPKCGDRIVAARYAAHEQFRCPQRTRDMQATL